MKFKHILISLIILILPVLSICSCTLPGANRQDELVDVLWETDENEYGIELTFTAFETHTARHGTIKYEDKEYDIHLGWSKGEVYIERIGYYGNVIGYDGGGARFEITGNYTIIEESLVEIKFNNVYGDFEELKSLKDKKITVRATNVNRDEYDVSVLNCFKWQSENAEWEIYTYYDMRNFCVGTYGFGEDKIEIAVFWLDGKTFKVYRLKEKDPVLSNTHHYFDIDRIDGDAIIVGTYTNDSKQLHLIYTVQGETQPRISVLYSQSISNTAYKLWYPSSPDAAPLL